ncbi:cellulose synthase regulator protein [Klebsiella pneumoniae]|nr:cellulose synthase regulator protein [Klebsiella pneumoniae]
MKRLTTLALLAGMLSAPALHSEEPGSGSAAPLSFPQLNDAADSEPGDGRAPLRQPPPPPAMRRRRPLRRLCRTYPRR